MEQVSLLKVDSYSGNLREQLVRLLEPLGGLNYFCRSGDKVLLKPNFIMARSVESAATTHPAIILNLAMLLKDNGCTVAVGDSPGLGSATGVVNRLGLTADLKKLGVKVVELETPVPVNLERSAIFEPRYKSLELAKELEQFDRIINLPKLKTHGQMGLTLATKNLYGCVAGPAKGQWHFNIGNDPELFGRLLVEIALSVKANLHIIDGVIGMDGNGPTNGRPRNLGLLLAGTNPIAVDRVVVEMINEKPENFPIFPAAAEMKIPGVNIKEIKIAGDSLDSLKVTDFEIPAFKHVNFFKNKIFNQFLAKVFKQHLILNKKLCTQCRKCETQCPAKAISFNSRIQINNKNCIRCCCCQEMCPTGALSVKTPFIIKILRRLM